ncbi:MAG: 4-hydroxy-tetrahydrodipicolinate reductase [Acidiferrobacterales bacterium]|nr:4-hydroxy-tetrahydrodipicolinate reductase [Acidiferrobacterales bacterium]
MLRIAVSGSAGRMGKTLIQAVYESQGVELTHSVEVPGHDSIGSDAGLLSGVGDIGVEVKDSLDTDLFDVLIEFTTPEATMQHVAKCAAEGKDVVLGTTGLTEENLNQLQEAAKEIRVVAAPNMSVGVNLCFKLLQMAAETFGDSVDVEVIEAHHRAKVDAPSGTALKMGEVVAETLGRSIQEHGQFVRHGRTGARGDKTIGFATIRAGDIVGEHTVMFAAPGERVEITHRSSSRMNYANGSVRAALWLVTRPPGLYQMTDVLGFD